MDCRDFGFLPREPPFRYDGLANGLVPPSFLPPPRPEPTPYVVEEVAEPEVSHPNIYMYILNMRECHARVT